MTPSNHSHTRWEDLVAGRYERPPQGPGEAGPDPEGGHSGDDPVTPREPFQGPEWDQVHATAAAHAATIIQNHTNRGDLAEFVGGLLVKQWILGSLLALHADDPEQVPCRRDNTGICSAHGFYGLRPEDPCPTVAAAVALANSSIRRVDLPGFAP